MEKRSPGNKKSSDLIRLKKHIVNIIGRELELHSPDEDVKNEVISQLIDKAYKSTKVNLPVTIRDQIFHEIRDELLGYGPIQALLEDENVSEVMVNGPDKVYIEREGKLIKTNITFESDAQVRKVIDRIILPLGRRIDEDSPTVDARLPDGSRVNAIIPPCAIDGPTITIRKFQKEKLQVADLINFNSISKEMAEFINACVKSRMNIVISGGTGSGKTTTLNVLSSFIPGDERVITIEDAAELQLQQDHVVRLETKSPNIEGKNEVTIRDLVKNSLRMRPERIIVGECRSGEALDMLQAMNTGHDGSMTTLHANTPRDAISRLETMCLMAGMDLPLIVIRKQIASAVNMIIQQSRLKDGSRKITSITEVVGMEGDTVVMTDIFKFEQTGSKHDGTIEGDLIPTGIRPQFSPRLESAGFKLRPEIFGANISAIMSGNTRKR